MEHLLKSFELYLQSLNIDVSQILPASISEQLPLFVSAPYALYTASLLNHEHVLVISKNEDSPTPEQISLQKNAIETLSRLPCIFVFKEVTREICKLLIKKGVCFVIPQKQCFLPRYIVSIREDKFALPNSRKRMKLSPLAQMLFVNYLIEKKENHVISFQKFIVKFKLNKVYVSRTTRELQDFGLAEITSSGHCKMLSFDIDRKTLWQKALPFLINPVQKRIRVQNAPQGLPLAGISALSAYSNLNDDDVQTHAIYHRSFDLKNTEVFQFEGDCLELWKYQPLASPNGIVDRFSLYLALKDDPDPRVQGALNEMLEAIWAEE